MNIRLIFSPKTAIFIHYTNHFSFTFICKKLQRLTNFILLYLLEKVLKSDWNSRLQNIVLIQTFKLKILNQ